MAARHVIANHERNSAPHTDFGPCRDVRLSDHGFAELAKDAILIEDIVANVMTAVTVEDYPERFRGRSVLALQRDADGRPVHVVWALPSGERRPAVLVTAYRPDLLLWDDEFKRRKSR